MTNVYLTVDFKEKEQVKSLGGKWDNNLKKWYVPAGLDVTNFNKWLQQEATYVKVLADNSQQGITLSQLLQKVNYAIKTINPQLAWIRAEVSEVSLHIATGHCYLELVETNNGQLLSKAKAIIRKEDHPLLSEQFKQATGDFLKPGMQILALVRLNFSVQYGFSLYIKDLDPSYTLGDLAAKLVKIRELLQQEGIYNHNKQLSMPNDFQKVAVLSPDAAAGLGDFKTEASLLQQHGLCDFYYYTAQFQGIDASLAITTALTTIFQAHNHKHFDAIVIIRGGGSAIDLAWLNDYEIAKLICQSKVIIFSGIGHERDNTIIDEIAGCRFDTPSKVIAHIFNTIVTNAQEASANAKEIYTIINHLYLNNFNATQEQLNVLWGVTKIGILQTTNNMSYQYHKILSAVNNSLAVTTTFMQQQYIRIYEHNFLQLQHLIYKLDEYFKQIKVVLPQIYLTSSKELPILFTAILHVIINNHTAMDNNITKILQALTQQAATQYHQTLQLTQELITNIISLGPKAILKRGYVIVRNLANIVLTSKVQAQKQQTLQLEFDDGILTTIHDKGSK